MKGLSFQAAMLVYHLSPMTLATCKSKEKDSYISPMHFAESRRLEDEMDVI